MTGLRYDKRLSITVDGEKIRYGILLGSEKIVFIKAGVPKDTGEAEDRDKSEKKYVDKYLIMAHRVHERMGATVICASNCDLFGNQQLAADLALIRRVIADLGVSSYELYFVGTSDGGEHSLKLSQKFPETVAFLGINSSWSDMADFLGSIQRLVGVKKTFVYGADDVDFEDVVPMLKTLDCDDLEIVVLDGVDHDFTGKVDAFIALIDLL